MWWVAGSGPARPPPCNRGPIRPCRGRSGRSDCPTRSVVARADPAYLTRPAQRGRTALGLTAAPVPCGTIPWTDSVRRAVVRRNSTTCDGPGNRTTGDRCIGRAAASGDPGPGPGRWVSDGGCHGGPMVCQPPAVLGAVEFAGVQQTVGEPVLVERRRDRVTCRAAGAPPRCWGGVQVVELLEVLQGPSALLVVSPH